ncbi:MAG: CoA activase, partial [Candidatus Riflebacteria bacterium]|nr:CoA activase [Candidatus Riflebacteria bacterium]
MNRYLGIDVGAETIKVVELSEDHGKLRWTDRLITEHGKDPAGRLSSVLTEVDWQGLTGAAVSGRLSRQLNLPRIPTKQAQARAYRFLHGPGEATVVSIGSHGFSVLELRSSGLDVFRENSRCSQGTGNFLRQLVERFDLTIDEASALSAEVADPAPLSGRCPVILKTDMTHLANKGTDRSRILAGLYDAVCENVQVQIKPRLSPPRTVLIGGVCRSPRIRENFRRFLDRHAMTLTDERADDGLFYEALGSALIATESAARLPSLERLIVPTQAAHLDRLPGLAEALPRVRRMAAPASRASSDAARQLILGFDIGSTGSKLVALDVRSGEPVFETYVRTGGDPVGASMALMRQYTQRPATADRVVGLGVTGSGREIVGSLMTICYGAGSVFIMNEIAAHAEGAVRYDPRVDTIFEIGGQDAKYIRLAAGRVVDAAMNEACSAGTGSFIEEQGRKLGCASDAAELGAEALAAPSGVSLGQHCSVFMAEIIDEAVAAGVRRGSIIAGIYDSVVQNYLNRVKGSRTIGSVIFCQGMPFAADALAAAVARQTGSEVIVPPSPGTVGALGIALLATRHLTGLSAPLAPTLFLEARVDRRDTFVCGSTSGCGGAGNRCRIDRLTTRVAGQSRQFTWGGGCSLYDKGARGRKLPPRTPDPFRERREAIEEIARRTSVPRGLPRIALTESFQLKGQFPFFATFLHRLGFDLDVITGGDQAALKRGIEEAHVPFCSPMQQFHGLVGSLADLDPDYIFLPMVRSTPRMADEDDSVLCPIVQGSPDLLRLDLGPAGAKVISPVIDMGKGNLTSSNFIASCRGLAASLGVKDERWQEAYRHAVQEQTRFDREFLERGRAALEFAKSHGLVAVVVLGRNYTIHNTVLNSNVPSILREQGALPVPVDCFPVTDDQPVFYDMYWGYGQRILRAAEQIRATPGLYSVFCSNYSCGPDSFTQHFYAHAMEGKPFVVIETDGHSGDAGTKTRIEAFLHCVDEHRAARPRTGPTTSLQQLEMDQRSVQEIRQNGERVLIPWMGPGSEVLAASLRGAGFLAETLPMPTRETLTIGRRHTSGKECLPMCVTAGSVLERIEREPDSADRYAF